jgi:aerobic-type carbon monoxide dehydrogenase small subunit (CoxS/CutS family)
MSDGVATVSRISLSVNGADYDLEVDNRTTLLDALREHLDWGRRRGVITASAAPARCCSTAGGRTPA